MSEDKLTVIRDSIVKKSKLLFPVAVIVAAAVTVSVALNAGKARGGQVEAEPSAEGPAESTALPAESGEPLQADAPKDVPLTANADEGIQKLIETYYSSMTSGDSAGMAALYDELTENERLRCEEMAKYLDRVSNLEVYTKRGLEEGATLVYAYYRICFQNHEEEVPGWQTFYVFDDGQGGLRIKNEKNLTQEEKDYVVEVSAQDDTVEFNNRVNAEYNELMEATPQLLAYLGEFGAQVDAALGVRLAELNAATAPPAQEGGGEADPAAGAPESPAASTAPAESGPQYATATTTVNVRNSDSEQADKLGKVSGGTKVQVQEVRVNGWTKIVYEGGDGYIKSEFLQLEESAAGLETTGTVKATTNIKIRSAASEQAEVLGLLPGGESLELIANENGWCKVKYNGKVAYVKAEYVTQ